MLATAIFVSLILATQFSFATFLAVAGALGLAAASRAVATAWAHYRETRRKERMRREVIRKHTQTASCRRRRAAGGPPEA